eukprot:GDKH01003107.1.p3 GENE.GDKH01003107.1~~GDKH01003107.1.p3  ORF type:complete len:54 (-),score=8.00 GDKH01003107.1:32-193(-)
MLSFDGDDNGSGLTMHAPHATSATTVTDGVTDGVSDGVQRLRGSVLGEAVIVA